MKKFFSEFRASQNISSIQNLSKTLISINPSTTEILGKVDVSTLSEIKQKVQQCQSSQKKWREKEITERVKLLNIALKTFVKEKTFFMQLITQEMGKPINESDGEMEDGFECIQWYLDNVSEILKTKIDYEDQHEIHETTYQPYGVTASIVPWNFPFLNFVWSAIPNLLVGNTVVFKHSEKIPLFTQQLERVMNSILPEGVFSVIYGDGMVGNQLICQGVDQVCFTGSSQAGLSIHQVANKLSTELNKIILVHTELGGSAPGIVFEDVDIESTARLIYKARFDNCGQVCDGLKRLIVHESIVDQLIESLAKLLAAKNIGDPINLSTHIGPLVDEKQLLLLKDQVQESIIQGATLVTPKEIPSLTKGYFYPPTLITNVKREMRVWQEEVFGPVLPIITFSSLDEAIELANDTIYGLGGYVYSNNNEFLKDVRLRLDTGMVSANGTYYIRPFMPFTSGGYGVSGTGTNNGVEVFKKLSKTQITSYPYRRTTQTTKSPNAQVKKDLKKDLKKDTACKKLIEQGIWHIHSDGVVEIEPYELPLKIGCKQEVKNFKISLFVYNEGSIDEDIYYVATYGDLNRLRKEAPLVRLQSLCPHGHYFHSAHCDCDEQRDLALEKISEDNIGGVFIVGVGEKHSGRGIGQVMIAGLYSYGYQTGRDVVTSSFNDLSFRRDERDFEPMLDILGRLGLSQIRLLTNNPDKVNYITQSTNIKVLEVVDLTGKITVESLKERILLARSGHNYNQAELEKLRSEILDKEGHDPLANW